MQKNLPKIALVLVAMAWGAAFIFNDFILEYLSPAQILALRFTLATIISAIFLFKKLKKFSWSEFKWGVLSGLFMFLGFYYQTIGLDQTTVSKNAFLSSLSVIFIPFINRSVFKEKISRISFLAATITLVGVGFLSYDGSEFGQLNSGDIYSLISAVFFGSQMLVNERCKKYLSDEKMMVSQMFTSAVLSWLFIIFTNDLAFNLSVNTLASIGYLGLVATCLAYAVQNYALNYVPSTTVSLILASESIFASLFAVIFQGESLTAYMLIGGALIILSIIISEVFSNWEPMKIK